MLRLRLDVGLTEFSGQGPSFAASLHPTAAASTGAAPHDRFALREGGTAAESVREIILCEG